MSPPGGEENRRRAARIPAGLLIAGCGRAPESYPNRAARDGTAEAAVGDACQRAAAGRSEIDERAARRKRFHGGERLRLWKDRSERSDGSRGRGARSGPR
jgi:hypothetical protein